MCEASAKQIALVVQEDLRFVNQSAKGRGMDDAIAIALKIIARGCGVLRHNACRVTALGGMRKFQAQQRSMTARTMASGAELTRA